MEELIDLLCSESPVISSSTSWKLEYLREEDVFLAHKIAGKIVQTIGHCESGEFRLSVAEGIFLLQTGRAEFSNSNNVKEFFEKLCSLNDPVAIWKVSILSILMALDLRETKNSRLHTDRHRQEPLAIVLPR